MPQPPVQLPVQYSKTMKEGEAFIPMQQTGMTNAMAPYNKTGNYRDFTDQELRKRELMDKFDDIPIKELNKAEGYQQQIKQEVTLE